MFNENQDGCDRSCGNALRISELILRAVKEARLRNSLDDRLNVASGPKKNSPITLLIVTHASNEFHKSG
jgi:hypothetical protein